MLGRRGENGSLDFDVRRLHSGTDSFSKFSPYFISFLGRLCVVVARGRVSVRYRHCHRDRRVTLTKWPGKVGGGVVVHFGVNSR